MVTSQPRGRSRNAASPKAGTVSASNTPIKRNVVAKSRPLKKVAQTTANSKPPRSRRKPTRETDVTARLRGIVARALDDLKARDIHEIDVSDKTSFTDLMVVVSGTSTRHVKSIADEVVKSTKQAGLPPLGVEGQREGEWVLVDLGDIIVHIMLPRTREFYGLERLWTVGDDESPAAAAI